MHCVQQISDKIYWIGGNDRRLERFENMFPIPKGVAYNSSIILDEKTAVIDTVDESIRNLYLENIKYLLNGRELDYLIVNHMEPDHCGNIEDLLNIYPNLKIVGNKKTFTYFEQFYNRIAKDNYLEVKEGEVLDLGEHKLKFFATPMVHWPEVTVTYEETKKILFSADAFGSFGTLNGNIFKDEVDFEGYYLSEMRRYYSNIVGKFGPQVQSALKKISSLEIDMVVPLHGTIWRTKEDIEYLMDLYNKWSTYTPEKKGVLIAYGTMYGNTANFADLIANKLAQKGIKDIKVFDVSKTHPSYIVSEAWIYSNLIIAAPTYNMSLYLPMDSLLHELSELNFQNRKVSIIGNHTWASGAMKNIKAKFENNFKNMEIVGEILDLKSCLKPDEEEKINTFVDEIINSLEN
ncbi:MAG: FprA family A-type flavoprotein [Leptotrichiaceae bacterium]|nr:FprA family A-type flavoprotein [Leptotrichiaceae bacterium]